MEPWGFESITTPFFEPANAVFHTVLAGVLAYQTGNLHPVPCHAPQSSEPLKI
jgi:hypothetical protein